ncbi:glucose-methanol-choline (GMC) oxidoreductase family protein [Musa troglodytarum]|uniref:Glucose-methanol-choline (GMC) oxidoreductase family protein n=1 Tax=Musa troglodytarum TaxID=320322 RepID=A0A9E7K0U8_9LILI|nr:glucose-methanol-choline (GMC) oxidoreductase family protein [Musa troglodytarum]
MEPEDVEACVEGLETMKRAIETKALSKFRYPNQSVEDLLALSASSIPNHRPRHENDTTSSEQYCKDVVLTI